MANACNADKATAIKRQNTENENQKIESLARRKKRQPIPERFSGDGSAPPRFRFGFFSQFLSGVCLAAAGACRGETVTQKIVSRGRSSRRYR